MVADSNALKAWKILATTVYNGKKLRDGPESIITGRPTFEPSTHRTETTLNYDAADLIPAWDYFIKSIGGCRNSDGFRYDLVDVTRQVLANYALPLQQKMAAAYRQKDLASFNKYSSAFLVLISDMDRLLQTRRDFLLGTWLADARRCGITASEKALYERNARDLITLWGGPENPLHEYSCRQWSGLLNDFYKRRWEQFFVLAGQSLKTGREMDLKAFDKHMQQWEWKWVNTQKAFPVTASGSAVAVAKQLYDKYRSTIANP
jgi:alpha-N-acetylglucosaminidase